MSVGFWWVLLGMAIFGGIHSVLAGQGPRLLARRLFGEAGRRWYRLGYNLLAGIILIGVVALVRILPDKVIFRIPMPLMLLTMAMQGIAILSMIFVVHETGILVFVGLVSEETQKPQLATGGIYRFMRHPLYTASLVVLWLFPIMSWNILAFDLGATAYIMVGIHFEELRLLRQFGKKYADYRRRTPMLFPLPGFLRKT
jgi:protein-S-isoprenylcysteine O-methyltransferase Ste14